MKIADHVSQAGRLRGWLIRAEPLHAKKSVHSEGCIGFQK